MRERWVPHLRSDDGILPLQFHSCDFYGSIYIRIINSLSWWLYYLMWLISESRDIDTTRSALMSLVDALPFHHRCTLHYLMTHLCRVCRLQVEGGHQEPLSTLCLVFCHILLRPAWENIMWAFCCTLVKLLSDRVACTTKCVTCKRLILSWWLPPQNWAKKFEKYEYKWYER